MKFCVLALPRSRTAWLANFLTYGDLFCYHDGLESVSSIEEYTKKVEGKGDSNTGLIMFDFLEHHPDCKIIIIDTSIDASVSFIKENYGIDSHNEMLFMKKRLDALDGLHIPYDDINTRLQEIWEYVSDEPFNKERADMLLKLNVQINELPHSTPEELNSLMRDMK